MKFAKVIAGAVVTLLGLTAAAHAGPISIAIGTAIAGALGAGVIGAQIITAAVGILFSVGVSLLARALTPTPDEAKQPAVGVSGQIQVGGDNPLSFIVGTYNTPGSLEYANTWGNDGETPNAYYTQVISLSDLPVDSLAETFVNGQKVTYYPADATSAGIPVAQFRKNGQDYLWIKFYDGTQTTPDSFLVAKFSALAGRPWTSDQIGRGVSYAIVTARINRSLFTGFPSVKFTLKGIPLYDPRKDSTVGGSGMHRWSTPSTWEWSDNVALITYNIMRGVYYGSTWVYGMQNLAAARLPVASWMAAASACDATVPLAAGGVEKRYRGGAEISVDTSPMDVVEEFLKAASARLADVGGLYKIHVGSPGSAVYSFTDDQLVITEPRNLKPFFGLENTYNAVHASYPEPAEAWVTKDAPPRYFPTLEPLDDSRRLIANATFPAVPWKNQVQRLMLELILNERRFRKHVVVLGPSAYRLEPNDIVEWTSVRNGYDTKLFFVMAVDGAPTYNQTLTLMEVDPADYDWSTAFELPDSVGFLGPVIPPPQAITDWFAEGVTVITAGGKRWPGIKLSWSGNQDDVRAVKWQVREKANPSNVVIRNGYTEEVAEGEVDITANLVSSTLYQARGIYVGFSGRDFIWSDWIDCTTPGTRFNDLSAELDTLGADARAYLQNVYTEVRNIRDDLETFAANVGSAASQDVVNKSVFQKRVGRMSAQIIDERVIRVSADAALAQQTTALESRMDGTDGTIAAQALAISQNTTSITNLDGFVTALATTVDTVQAQTDYGTAFGLFGMKAISGPVGVSVRLQAVAQTEVGGTQYNGGWFLDLFANGTSQFLIDVTRFIVLAGSTKFSPLVFQGGILKLDNVQVNGADILTASIDTAQIKNAAIKSAQIDDLTVNTIHIVNGAIARTASTAGSGSSKVEGATIIICMATVANPSGAGVLIEFLSSFNVACSGVQASGANNTIGVQMRVTRNGVTIATSIITAVAQTGAPSIGTEPRFSIDLPGVGTHIYRCELQITSATGGTAANSASATTTMRIIWTSK